MRTPAKSTPAAEARRAQRDKAGAKPPDQYLAIPDAYADQGVASHWYVVPPVAQERILHAAAVLDVRDMVTVWDWPPVAVGRD
jgi:hypothetical protein